MKLQRKLFLPVGDRGSPSGRGKTPEDRGSVCLDSIAEAALSENPIHLKTSAAPLCSLSPGSRAAGPGHGAPQPAWHRGGEYGSRSLGRGYRSPTRCHLPSLVALTLQHCSTSATASCHADLCWNRNKFNKWYVEHCNCATVMSTYVIRVRTNG